MKKRLLSMILGTFILLASCTAPKTDDPAGETNDTQTNEIINETEKETEPMPELDNTVIHYGTPTLDGKLDDMYKKSFSITEAPLKNLCYSPYGNDMAVKYMSNTTGTIYYLWDENYLYSCIVVHDETLCSRGEDWRMNTVWPWSDDGAEIYLWFSDEDCFAVHNDAHGIRSVVDEHIWGDNHSSAKTYHDTPKEDWKTTVDKENNTYTIEIRIKLPDYVKAGSKIGTLLEINDRWAIDDEKMVGALCPYPRFPGADNFLVELAPKS